MSLKNISYKRRLYSQKGTHIKTCMTTISPDDGACTIQIEWKGEQLGKHTSMMVLFIDDTGKISQMHEVYNEHKESQISEAYSEYQKNKLNGA